MKPTLNKIETEESQSVEVRRPSFSGSDALGDRLKAGLQTSTLDLAAIRAKLAGATGPEYWRSLEEVAQTKNFQEWMDREFPAGAAEWTDGVSRRSFLKL